MRYTALWSLTPLTFCVVDDFGQGCNIEDSDKEDAEGSASGEHGSEWGEEVEEEEVVVVVEEEEEEEEEDLIMKTAGVELPSKDTYTGSTPPPEECEAMMVVREQSCSPTPTTPPEAISSSGRSPSAPLTPHQQHGCHRTWLPWFRHAHPPIPLDF